MGEYRQFPGIKIFAKNPMLTKYHISNVQILDLVKFLSFLLSKFDDCSVHNIMYSESPVNGTPLLERVNEIGIEKSCKLTPLATL